MSMRLAVDGPQVGPATAGSQVSHTVGGEAGHMSGQLRDERRFRGRAQLERMALPTAPQRLR